MTMKRPALFAVFFILLLLISNTVLAVPSNGKKREFRGAWIQAVNGQYLNKSSEETQQFLVALLNNLQKANINAIFFQVRVEGDALYPSSFEPWSRFLSGKQGVAPSPYWDPMEFMIGECHRRGMEFHAWINPYRAKTKNTVLSSGHPYYAHPERFVEYEEQLFFNPGLPENRDYICQIAADILLKYDVDGLHIDDYFYPYPANGAVFHDERAFAGNSHGFIDLDDWRRNNVNLMIEQLHYTVRELKPWVKFGVSPFGIYRNLQADNGQRAVRGLQGYDDLYADVLLWVNKGWVDYCIPQLYWEIGHKVADYETLIRWWNDNAGNRPLFIGQDVNRTVKARDPFVASQNQQLRKLNLQRSLENVDGICLWDAASAANNIGDYLTVLASNYQRYPALMPQFPFMDKKAPKKVKSLMPVQMDEELVLCWTPRETEKEMDKAVRFVVYRFDDGEKTNISDPSHIVAVTQQPFYVLPKQEPRKCTYVVTALDRLQNESKGVKCKIKPAR